MKKIFKLTSIIFVLGQFILFNGYAGIMSHPVNYEIRYANKNGQMNDFFDKKIDNLTLTNFEDAGFKISFFRETAFFAPYVALSYDQSEVSAKDNNNNTLRFDAKFLNNHIGFRNYLLPFFFWDISIMLGINSIEDEISYHGGFEAQVGLMFLNFIGVGISIKQHFLQKENQYLGNVKSHFEGSGLFMSFLF